MIPNKHAVEALGLCRIVAHEYIARGYVPCGLAGCSFPAPSSFPAFFASTLIDVPIQPRGPREVPASVHRVACLGVLLMRNDLVLAVSEWARLCRGSSVRKKS